MLTSDSELETWEKKKFDGSPYKEAPEKLAENKTLESMVMFDKTFKLIMNHVRKMLSISQNDLNRHI